MERKENDDEAKPQFSRLNFIGNLNENKIFFLP